MELQLQLGYWPTLDQIIKGLEGQLENQLRIAEQEKDTGGWGSFGQAMDAAKTLHYAIEELARLKDLED